MDVWLLGFYPAMFGIEAIHCFVTLLHYFGSMMVTMKFMNEREYMVVWVVTCTFEVINVWEIYGKFFVEFVQDIFLEHTHTLI